MRYWRVGSMLVAVIAMIAFAHQGEVAWTVVAGVMALLSRMNLGFDSLRGKS